VVFINVVLLDEFKCAAEKVSLVTNPVMLCTPWALYTSGQRRRMLGRDISRVLQGVTLVLQHVAKDQVSESFGWA